MAGLAASQAISLELSTGSEVCIENQWIDLLKMNGNLRVEFANQMATHWNSVCSFTHW